MEYSLSIRTLESLAARVATLGAGRYAMPVRIRIRGQIIDCRVPTWVSISDLICDAGEVTLVFATEGSPELSWVFVRGPAAVVDDPEWSGLEPSTRHRSAVDDLYQLLRVTPRRIELIDERRGWGHRETLDL